MERNLNYSPYLYIIYALVFLATRYTMSTLDKNAFRGKSTAALARGWRGRNLNYPE